MARAVRDSKLDSPTARDKLRVSPKPYYRSIDTGLHLGYRKGKRGGRWVARYYVGDERYIVETIGAADDIQIADGGSILSFSQAQTKARHLAAERRTPSSVASIFTVGGALDDYVSRLETEHRKTLPDALSRIRNDIRPHLGHLAVTAISRDDISRWLKALADRPRNVRGKTGSAARALAAPSSDDERRRRRASANRTLTVLRAALNQAFRDGKATSDTAWRVVKPFREVDQARIRYFTADEVRRLVNAAHGAFRIIVNAALFTGARYGELCRLRVSDFNPDSGTAFVAQSKSGKARHVVLTDEGQRFFKSAAAGRLSSDLLFTRDDGEQWGASHQIRAMRDACKAARIPPAGFHTLRHTAASHLVMAGVPLPVVAQNLGHTDSRMTEKHYAHLAPSYVAEQIRRFAPTFGTAIEDKVAPIGSTRA